MSIILSQSKGTTDRFQQTSKPTSSTPQRLPGSARRSNRGSSLQRWRPFSRIHCKEYSPESYIFKCLTRAFVIFMGEREFGSGHVRRVPSKTKKKRTRASRVRVAHPTHSKKKNALGLHLIPFLSCGVGKLQGSESPRHVEQRRTRFFFGKHLGECLVKGLPCEWSSSSPANPVERGRPLTAATLASDWSKFPPIKVEPCAPLSLFRHHLALYGSSKRGTLLLSRAATST